VLALCGIMATVRSEGWRSLAAGRLGLLVFAGAGALAAGAGAFLEPYATASAGAATALAGALAAEGLFWRKPGAPRASASLLLASACAVAAVAALVVGSRAPEVLSMARVQAVIAEAIEPGSRAYVWGVDFDLEIYARARAVPATPQLASWMLDGIGPPVPAGGLCGRPAVATLDALDRRLSEAPPAYLAIMKEPSPTPADLPRFGPILRSRYRVVFRTPEGTLYQLSDARP
jgi:hypothetical protein